MSAVSPPPTLEQIRSEMGIPSLDTLRGQRDSVGFASRADSMTRVWELAASPPAPLSLGPSPAPGVWGIICPHDDYLYAARVYRTVIPLLSAPTIVGVGVFHRYRRFGITGRLVFDPYENWRTPQGEARVSSLREEVLSRLQGTDFVQDAGMHDSEHSLEALFYWLAEERADREILPILVPEAPFERMNELAERLASALSGAMCARGLELGKDVALAISADAVHYGRDFSHTPFGDGGPRTYQKATENDLALLRGPLAGPLSVAKARQLYETFVDPEQPERYRLTWCGRFSIPLGLLLLQHLSAQLGLAEPAAHPVAYATSVDAPELPVRDLGLGATAPADLFHFVGYPAVALAPVS